jgi:hypothetical protein
MTALLWSTFVVNRVFGLSSEMFSLWAVLDLNQ